MMPVERCPKTTRSSCAFCHRPPVSLITLTLMSGGNNTDVQLEVGLFIREAILVIGTLLGRVMLSFGDPTEDAYRRITGSGLNALWSNTQAIKSVLETWSTTPWSCSVYTHGAMPRNEQQWRENVCVTGHCRLSALTGMSTQSTSMICPMDMANDLGFG